MNMMLRSLPLTALSLLLGFFFIFVGSIKISPKVNEDIFRDMVNIAVLYFIFCLLIFDSYKKIKNFSNKNLVDLTKFFRLPNTLAGDHMLKISVFR